MAPRKAPFWVRSLTSRQLHATALKLQRDFAGDALSERQDWLFGRLVNELEWRRATSLRHRRPLEACHCALCMPPDVWGDLEYEVAPESPWED